MAALVVVFATSCTSFPGTGTSAPRGDGSPEIRVDIEWRVDLATDRPWEVSPRELGRPVLSPGGDLLVGATNGWVYRMHAESGEIRWATPVGGSIDAPATLANGRVYVGSDAGFLAVLDWFEGEELWRFETRGSLESRPVAADGRVFFTDSDDVLYAVDAVTGDLLWDYQRRAPEFFTIKGGGEPLVVGNTIYVGFADGVLTALYADTGEEIWDIFLGDESGEFGDIDLPMISQDDRLITSSFAGGVHAVERSTGALLWRNPIDSVVAMVYERGWIFGATSAGNIFAMDSRNGEISWQYRVPNDLSPMGVSSTGRFLAVPMAQGSIYWFRISDGQPLLQWDVGSGFQGAPVFDDERGYVMSNRGYLYGFGLAY